jgi:hypothetical protein
MLDIKRVSEEEFFRIMKERKAYSAEYWETDHFNKKDGVVSDMFPSDEELDAVDEELRAEGFWEDVKRRYE